MGWTVTCDEDKAIIDEIHAQTDRGAALIAGAYLEQRLVLALKARMNRNEAVENELFRTSGPLGTFSAKISLALLMGIIDANTHRILKTIKEIRNDFAHNAEPLTFESQRIRALSNNINISAHIQLATPNGQTLDFNFKPDGKPKTAFLNAIKLVLLALDMELKMLPPRVPAAPALPPLKQPQ